MLLRFVLLALLEHTVLPRTQREMVPMRLGVLTSSGEADANERKKAMDHRTRAIVRGR